MAIFTYLGMVTAAILAVVATLVLAGLAWLVYRAAMQTKRVLAVHRDAGVPRGTWRRVLSFFFREIFASYTELHVGHVVLPYDPRKPLSESWPA